MSSKHDPQIGQSLAARVRWAMDRQGITQTELARLTGVTQGTVQQILSGRTNKTRYLTEIANVLNVTTSFLSGFTDNPDASSFDEEEGRKAREQDDEAIADSMGLLRIRQVDVGYAMGDGSYLDGHFETSWRYFDKEMVRRATAAPSDQLFIATGIGDSMGATIHDSDTLIIDRTQNLLNQQDRLWAISYGDLGMVKRVRRLPNGKILIISDNPAVDNFEADAQDVHIIGRVALLIRRT